MTMLKTSKRVENRLYQWHIWIKEKYPPFVSIEISYLSRLIHARVSFGGEESQLQFSIAAWWFAAYVTFNHLPDLLPKRLTHYETTYKGEQLFIPVERKTQISIFPLEGGLINHDWDITIDILKADNFCGWKPPLPGFSFSFSPVNWLFGRLQYKSKVLRSDTKEYEFKAGDRYRLSVAIEKATWERPRWRGKPLTVIRADVGTEGGEIGIPNGRLKFGEHDATFSHCFPLDDLLEFDLDRAVNVAIRGFTEKVEESRSQNN